MLNSNNWSIYNTSNGLTNNKINTIYIDNQNNLWIGTYKGVSKFNGLTWKTIGLNTDLNNSSVLSIAGDGFGTKWFATQGWDVFKLLANPINGIENVCQGQSNISYTINPIQYATSYNWQLPSGIIGSSSTNTISVNYTNSAQSGNISVSVQNDCGISDTVCLPITVFVCSGINESSSLNETIYIFPNPTKDNLTIETNSSKEQRLEIINLIGQTVYTNNINKKATINTSPFANGVYILKLSSDKETLVRKFVKE